MMMHRLFIFFILVQGWITSAKGACSGYVYECGNVYKCEYQYDFHLGEYVYRCGYNWECGYQYSTNIPEDRVSVTFNGIVKSAADESTVQSARVYLENGSSDVSDSGGTYTIYSSFNICPDDSKYVKLCAEADRFNRKCTEIRISSTHRYPHENFSLTLTHVPEYALPFVSGLYRDVLKRSGSAPEKSVWADYLRSNTKKQVADFFLSSAEYRRLLIGDYYSTYLRRTPGEPELSWWIANGYRSFSSAEGILAQFQGSPEYFNLSGSSVTFFLTQLYHDLFGRGVDPGGLAYWSDQVNRMGRAKVASAILSSAEWREKLIHSWYQSYLRRSAEPSAISVWIQALNAGQSHEAIQSFILTSPEYQSLQGK